jgi:PHD/YefM family antitoxin component YafN of YafNO toxin-antitoxin module
MNSAEEHQALEETLEILSDERALAALIESEQDVREGRLFALDAVIRDLGLG